MGRKLGATPRFGKAAERTDYSRPEGILRSFAGIRSLPGVSDTSITGQQKARADRPGFS